MSSAQIYAAIRPVNNNRAGLATFLFPCLPGLLVIRLAVVRLSRLDNMDKVHIVVRWSVNLAPGGSVILSLDDGPKVLVLNPSGSRLFPSAELGYFLEGEVALMVTVTHSSTPTSEEAAMDAVLLFAVLERV
tara:strand:+ start:732 stop:1127 length:396 start_codon:yes stop_codon:yes gene_type:complete